VTMPTPKDIKKVFKATQGTKAAGNAPDLDELLGRLPKGTPQQQLEAELMFRRLQEEQAARYAPVNPATERGNASLDEIRRILGPKSPDITKAHGGGVHMAGGGKLFRRASNVGKGEKSFEAARNLMDSNRPLSLAERQFVAEMSAKQAEELARMRPAEVAPVEAKKSKGPSPKPARAKPKTKAEINAIAERVAPQMTGEFVRAKPGESVSVAGKSKKQFDLEQELQHDIQRSREVPEAKNIDLEPHRGSVMLSLPGDISIADYDIFGIGGEGLRMPSRQYGGPRFGLGHPEEAGWASGLVPAAGFQRRVTGASEQYGGAPVLANFMAMGPEGLNYAEHYADALLKLSKPEQMTPRNVDHFNKIIRSGNAKAEFPDFPGIEHPEASYLYMIENPEARKHYNSVMQLTKTTEELGLPSGLNVRHAVSEPELRDMERGMTGFSVMQMEPGVANLKPSMHPTYSHDIPGKFLGRTDVLMPYEMTFPDTVAGIRANPKQAASEFGTLQMLGGKQIIDNQLLDELEQYRRRIKELTGKKDGGVVHMGGGGDPGEVSGDMFKPKPFTIPQPLTDLADAFKRQFSREKRSMSKPGAVTDVLLRGPAAFTVGTPMDLLGMAGEGIDYLQTKIPGLRKKASVMDQQTSVVDKRSPQMGYAPKVQVGPQGVMPYGTEHFQERLNQAGLTTGEERPLLELGTAITAPFAAQKALQYGRASAKALTPTFSDILETQLENMTAPMRMSIVPEGGPSGKLKAPANDLGFYNPAEKAALNVQRKKGQGSAFVSDLKKTPGVNDERLAELGLGDLASRPEVTREEVLAAAEQNRIPLRETVLKEGKESLEELSDNIYQLKDDMSYMDSDSREWAEADRTLTRLQKEYEAESQAKRAMFGPQTHADYNMPGGANYREIRVALPENSAPAPDLSGYTVRTVSDNKYTGQREIEIRDQFGQWVASRSGFGGSDEEALENFASTINKGQKKNYNFINSTHHGDEPNVLFHLRVADHTDVDGKKGLLIDELQSDWHQQGRDKGYGDKLRIGYSIVEQEPGFFSLQKRGLDMPVAYGTKDHVMDRARYYNAFEKGVPDAPFKDNWYQLGLKRAIKEAADTGMDRVYLTTGQRQADRYDLSKHIDELVYQNGTLHGYKNGNLVIDKVDVPEDKLSDFIGKDAAKKLLGQSSNEYGTKSLSGLDLKVGGEGMRQYYDKTYKNYLDKYAKQFGATVGETTLPAASKKMNQLSSQEIEAITKTPGWFDDFMKMSGHRGPLMLSDEQYSSIFNKLLPKYAHQHGEKVYYIDVTPKMRESAAKGQSYKDGGAVTMAEGGQLTFAKANQMLQQYVSSLGEGAGMAKGGAVDYETSFNEMLQRHVQGMAEGGEVNTYDADPDTTDGGRFIQGPAFADGGAVKSIWTVN